MGAFSESYSYHVVADASKPVAVPCPSKALIHKLRVVKDTGTFTVTAYNRKFTGPAKAIHRILNDGNTKTKLVFEPGESHDLRVGDQVTVASSSVAGYNTLHVVTEVVDATTVVTDQAYSANGVGGTATLNIQTAQQALYEVIGNFASASNIARFDAADAGDAAFMCNQDPHGPVGPLKTIYLKFSATGTYWVTIGAESNPI